MRWEDLEKELVAIPGFKEGYDQQYPYDDVALEIARLRADRDMTQTDFGRLVDVPQSTVARLESGQQNPSVRMLQRIARATGTELVIEFRRPKRKRRTKRRTTAASSASDERSSEPLAASGGDD